MKIEYSHNINPFKQTQIKTTISFKQNTAHPKFITQDEFVVNSSFIKEIHKKKNRLKSIEFKNPIPINEAFNKLSQSDPYLLNEFLLNLHSSGELKELGNILSTHEIGKTKVKGLAGMGAFAMSFTTEDGKILKITDIEHFPGNRTPADFDIPIFKHGKIGSKHQHYHYYLEEFATQDDITQAEIRELVKHIKALGYKMKDYLTHYDDTYENNSYRTEQFGRAKNGKIYLIDPGCAIETDEVFIGNKNFSFKHLLNKITKKLKPFL